MRDRHVLSGTLSRERGLREALLERTCGSTQAAQRYRYCRQALHRKPYDFPILNGSDTVTMARVPVIYEGNVAGRWTGQRNTP